MGIVASLHYTYKAYTGDFYAHTVIIPPGSSLEKIATILRDHKIIDNRWSFIWNARLRRLYASLKSGEYLFPSQRSLETVLMLLVEGKTVVHKFTAVEGQTVQEIVDNVSKAKELQGRITNLPSEGELYPDTYYFSYGDQRQALINRMIKAHQTKLKALWQVRDRSIPFSSPQEAVILAAIIEKETPIEGERPYIAGLFYNRLRLGMPLQSDPTVLYGLYRLNGLPLNRELSRSELSIPTPFNTYLFVGLPPEPICNPGFSSIEAALHPKRTDSLYFVADGTGGHVFSSTYEEHKRHHQALRVRRNNKIEREVSKKGSN